VKGEEQGEGPRLRALRGRVGIVFRWPQVKVAHSGGAQIFVEIRIDRELELRFLDSENWSSMEAKSAVRFPAQIGPKRAGKSNFEAPKSGFQGDKNTFRCEVLPGNSYYQENTSLP
jgi:hypothetical protein